MPNPPVDIDKLYEILRDIANAKEVWSYKNLSREYHRRFAVSYPWRNTWGPPLLIINTRAFKHKLPALSAVITYAPLQGVWYSPPGDGFWGCPGVPQQPSRRIDEYKEWIRILNDVHANVWPVSLP